MSTVTTASTEPWHYPHYDNQGGEPSSLFRDGDWKLIHYYEDGRNELYDLQTDPLEQANLADKAEMQEIQHELLRELKAWIAAQDDGLTVFHEPLMLDAPDTWVPRSLPRKKK